MHIDVKHTEANDKRKLYICNKCRYMNIEYSSLKRIYLVCIMYILLYAHLLLAPNTHSQQTRNHSHF